MKILCLGSLNLDHVYSMPRFIEAGETIAAFALEDFCGGKGLNQSIALSHAGCDVCHAGMVGTDGEPLRTILADNGVDTSLIRTVDGPSGHAIIQLDRNGENCIIIYSGSNGRIDEAYIDAVYAQFLENDIVLMQNETACLPYALRRARELHFRVALNASPINDELLHLKELDCVNWFILNEIEGEAFTGETDYPSICRKLRALYPRAAVMLTMGAEGCLYFDGKRMLSQKPFPAQVVDTTAAGDTFTGYFLAGIVEGLSMEDTLRLASRAASMAVSKKGAAASIPMRSAVDRALAPADR